MLIVLGTLGLPFLPSDIAHTPPTLNIVFLAVSVLVIFGAIFIYIMNISFDAFVVFVAIATSMASIAGRLKGQGAGEMSPAVKELVISAASFVGLFVSDKLISRFKPTNTDIQQWITIWTYLVPAAMWGIVVFMGFRGIQALIKYRVSNTVPAPVSQGVRRFEGFQGAGATLSSRLDTALKRVQDTMTRITGYVDSTCSIIRDVEMGYIGAVSGLTQSEMKLPPDVVAELRKKRKETAEKTFLTLRKINASAKNTKILECFQNEDETIREYCIQLEGYLENAESMAQIAKVQSITAELIFAQGMIAKAKELEKEEFQNAPSPDSFGESIVKKYTALSGPMLAIAAEVLLQKEAMLFTFAENLGTMTQIINAQIDKTKKKASMVASGNYDKSSEEVQEADARLSLISTKAIQGAKP